MKNIFIIILFYSLIAVAQYESPPLPSNAAKETGGNLDSIKSALTSTGLGTYPVGGSTWPVSFTPGASQAVTTNNGTFLGTYPSGSSTWQVSLSSLPALTTGSNVIGHVIVDTAPSTAVTGSFYQATQPVSLDSVPTHAVTYAGGSTIPVSLATAPTTPVTGTFFQSTQPVSGTVTANPGNGNFSTVPGSGSTWPVSIASMPSTPVTGTFWQATQPVTYNSSSTIPVSLASVPTHAVTSANGSSFITTPLAGSTWPVSIATLPSLAAGSANIGSINQGAAAWIVAQTNGGTFGTFPTGGSTWPVSGSFFQATQPVSGTVTANPGNGNFSTIPGSNSTWPVSYVGASTIPMTQVGFSGGSNTRVSLTSAGSTQILAANANRKHAFVMNQTGYVIYLMLGAGASVGQGILLSNGGMYEINASNLWLGTIFGTSISATASSVDVFEGTP